MPPLLLLLRTKKHFVHFAFSSCFLRSISCGGGGRREEKPICLCSKGEKVFGVLFLSPLLIACIPPPPLSLYPQSVSPTVPTAKRTGGGGFFSHSLSLSQHEGKATGIINETRQPVPTFFLDVLANGMRGVHVTPMLEPMGSLGGDVRQGRYLFLERGEEEACFSAWLQREEGGGGEERSPLCKRRGKVASVRWVELSSRFYGRCYLVASSGGWREERRVEDGGGV